MSNVELKQLDYQVFPSKVKTISVTNDPIYDGAHEYVIKDCLGFTDGETKYEETEHNIRFVQKNDDGTIEAGLQSEQLAFVLLDRCKKLNARFPSDHNQKQIKGLEMFLEGCEDRVKERLHRGVMGDLKK